MSFLLANNELPRKYLVELYGPSFHIWEKIYEDNVDDETKRDPKLLCEFKALVKRLKEKPPSRNYRPISVSLVSLEIQLDIRIHPELKR